MELFLIFRTKCDMCKRTSLAQYHLTMSDATVRNFCTYQCVMSFQVCLVFTSGEDEIILLFYFFCLVQSFNAFVFF